MRLIVGGGRASESAEAKGAVIVGVRTLSEGGRVGNFSREQVTEQKILFSIVFLNLSFHYFALSCMIYWCFLKYLHQSKHSLSKTIDSFIQHSMCMLNLLPLHFLA